LHANELHWIPDEQLDGPEHSTSHAHELPHATFLQADWPEQLTAQGPVPHCTFWHEFCD